ncbi:MAG: hypothetical protein JRG81_04085, partial [Deltaproteobacteria bacterium]|nr:hypothetical protein [Deltaproteobacteria bacterium]
MTLTSASVQAGDRPADGGLTISAKKPLYSVGETVIFSLIKYAGADDTNADLSDCYYIIPKKKDNGKWREFYTSPKNPFSFKILGLEKKFNFNWDQKDNERTHQARPGEWRIKFFAPKGNIGEPLVAKFT